MNPNVAALTLNVKGVQTHLLIKDSILDKRTKAKVYGDYHRHTLNTECMKVSWWKTCIT